MIPPEADAEFAASMEEVLETYQRLYDAERPVVCMDEQPVQLVKETREPVAATADRPRRVDYEYERAGTAAVFLFCEPLAGWREATARQHRTKTDWARQVACLLEGRYADCGSWLNIAENELSAMTRQCLSGRRIGELGTLQAEIGAWSTDVNGRQRGVDWRMKIADARCKLKSAYPKIRL